MAQELVDGIWADWPLFRCVYSSWAGSSTLSGSVGDSVEASQVYLTVLSVFAYLIAYLLEGSLS